MKSDYLQGQIARVKEKWNAEFQQRADQALNEYNREANVMQMVEQDVRNYMAVYSVGKIIKEILVCLAVSLVAGIAVTGFRDLNPIVFLVVAAAYVFLKRNPARDSSGNVSANPNLSEMIRVHLRFKSVNEARRQDLDAKKAECDDAVRRARTECETARDREIEQMKASYTARLKQEAAHMQGSQYPAQIYRTVMPEVQKMLQSHGRARSSYDIVIDIRVDEVLVQTSTGLEKHFSFASCGLAQISDLVKRTVLSTLTAKQIQLEVAKYAPGTPVKVDQNDTRCTVHIG